LPVAEIILFLHPYKLVFSWFNIYQGGNQFGAKLLSELMLRRLLTWKSFLADLFTISTVPSR
jgi:hypothetical protein